MRYVHLNGELVPESEAQISVFDRAVTFGDAVYEGFGILDGDIADFLDHHDRLTRSLSETGISWTRSPAETYRMLKDVVDANHIQEGFLYLQITRGVEDRDYVPSGTLSPTVIAYTQSIAVSRADNPPQARRMLSQPDWRWSRRDLKTTNLLAQVMAKTAAARNGADEALLVDADGHVTEGGSSSFFAVIDDAIVARPLGNEILNGITRRKILGLAEAAGLPVRTCLLTLADVYAASETFVTAASLNVCPVVEIDGRRIGNGEPGRITKALHATYIAHVRANFYSGDQG